MRPIILASQSPQRSAIMQSLKIPFEVMPANIDEKAIGGSDHRQRARKVAQAKALAIAEKYPEAIIIAADTYCVDGDEALEKPVDLDDARRMLNQQSGREVMEYTGVCYLDRKQGIEVVELAVATIKFRELSEQEIERYVTTEPVLTWSGAFCPAYDSGAALIDSISGSFTGFTHGLPLEVVIPLLRKSGISL